MRQDEFFKESSQWYISGAEITIEELYQMFKARMIEEENDLISKDENKA